MKQCAHLIIDSATDWQPYYPSQNLLTASDYLQTVQQPNRYHILNLCNDLSYLSTGYYVSLLAEARGQKVIPSVATINDLNNFSHYQLLINIADRSLTRYLKQHEDRTLSLLICFGLSEYPELAAFARQIFERYPCPTITTTATALKCGLLFVRKIRKNPFNACLF